MGGSIVRVMEGYGQIEKLVEFGSMIFNSQSISKEISLNIKSSHLATKKEKWNDG